MSVDINPGCHPTTLIASLTLDATLKPLVLVSRYRTIHVKSIEVLSTSHTRTLCKGLGTRSIHQHIRCHNRLNTEQEPCSVSQPRLDRTDQAVDMRKCCIIQGSSFLASSGVVSGTSRDGA